MSLLNLCTAVDPKHDTHNPLRYLPSVALTTVGVIGFLAVSLGMTYRMSRSRWRARYMLAMVIGGYCMMIGFVMRYVLRNNPDSQLVFIEEDLWIILSPCAFIAANYILLGRLARHTGTGQYLIVKPTILARVFIDSDILTFLMQAAGGSLAASKNAKTLKAGEDLFKVGMILQCVSYVFFCIVYATWIFRVRENARQIWTMSERMTADGTTLSGDGSYKWYSDWRALVGALALSCLGILIRSAYRTAEDLQGYHGALARNETTFYALDTLPLFIAVGIYVFFWPGQYINPDRVAAGSGFEKELTERGGEDLGKPSV